MNNVKQIAAFAAIAIETVVASDGRPSFASPVKLDFKSNDTLDKVLDLYYARPDGSLPVNNGQKYLTKDCPPEVRELIEQHVVKSLPPISGAPDDETSDAVPILTRTPDDYGALQARFAQSIRDSINQHNPKDE